MCYSAMCYFQNYWGDCQIHDFKNFEKEFGEKACYVGGVADCEEAELYIEENYMRFKEIQRQAIENKFVFI